MGLLEAVKDSRCLLSGFDPSVYSGADCAVLAEEFAAAAKAFQAASVLAAARAVECGSHRDRGFADGADWVARVSGSTGSQARQALRTAGQLEASPDTRQALLAGDISMPQAVEVADDTSGELLELARRSDLTRLRDVARERRMAAVPAEELHQRQHAARYFRHWRDQMGMVCFAGSLPPLVGLPLVRRIDVAAAKAALAARKTKGDGPAEGRDAHAADALVALSAGGSAKPARKGVDLVVVADLNALRRGHAHPGEPCHIIGGGPIPAEIAKELSKDAFIKAVLHDGTNIHTVAHLGRHIPATLRTALEVGTPPTFDGLACEHCGRKWGLQLDHENPVANQGPTSYQNLRALCWDDHRDKTERDRRAGLLGPNTPPNPRRPKKPPGRAP